MNKTLTTHNTKAYYMTQGRREENTKTKADAKKAPTLATQSTNQRLKLCQLMHIISREGYALTDKERR